MPDNDAAPRVVARPGTGSSHVKLAAQADAYQFRVEWFERGTARHSMPADEAAARRQLETLRAIAEEGGGVRGVVLLARYVSAWTVVE